MSEIHNLKCDACGHEKPHYSKDLPTRWIGVKVTTGADGGYDTVVKVLHICPKCIGGLEIRVPDRLLMGRFEAR